MINKKYRKEISQFLILVNKYEQDKTTKNLKAIVKKYDRIKLLLSELFILQKEVRSMMSIYSIYFNNIKQKFKDA